VFVADEIPSELVRIIEFLNEQMSPTEVVGIEIKRYSGQGVTTLVPKLVGSTAGATQRKAATRVETGPVTWGDYKQQLSPENHAIARGIYEQLNTWFAAHGHNFTPVLRRTYFGFQRPGGYAVAGMDLRVEATCRLWVKLPNDPKSLGLTDPFPGLGGDWDGHNRQWSWGIPSSAEIPDVGCALEISVPLQPNSGPMPQM